MLCVPHTSSILCGYVIQSVGYISLCSLIVPSEMSSLLPCHCQPVRWICCWGLFLAGFSWGCTEPTECSALGAAACRGLGVGHRSLKLFSDPASWQEGSNEASPTPGSWKNRRRPEDSALMSSGSSREGSSKVQEPFWLF